MIDCRLRSLGHRWIVVGLLSVLSGPITAGELGPVGDPLPLAAISCLVEPGRQATLSSQVPGVIDEILVERGQRVGKGEALFTLKREAEKASVTLEQARAQFAARRAERNRRLIERGMLSESERDEISTELSLSRMQVALAEARLQQMVTDSPFDGLITVRHKEVGEFVDSTPVLDVVQLDPLDVDVVLSLGGFGMLERGDSVRLRLEAPVDRIVEAEVTMVDPLIDPSSGTFGVTLSLDNPDGVIPAGVSCRLAAQTDVAG